MPGHIEGRTVIITGAASGFGRLVAQRVGAAGGNVVGVDIDEAELHTTVESVESAGGNALAAPADVTDLPQMHEVAATAVERFGAIDVIVNNAGVMPLAFYSDHAEAAGAWSRCIDINIKGVLNGIIAVHDQMVAQGRGHVINLSSIYGNHPVGGAGVYGATKAAVNYMSDALRQESHGRIKVTTVRPTGVPGTNLGSGVVNGDAVAPVLGADYDEYMAQLGAAFEGGAGGLTDVDSMAYTMLDPEVLADNIVYAIDQPWGVSISDITVRASGDRYKI